MGTAIAQPTRRMDVTLEEARADLDMCYGPKAQRPNGGNYKAVQNPDGSWNILGVPAFASHKMTKQEGGHEIDAEWQRENVRHHGNMWADGFLNPLIINHHDELGFADVYAGGHFLPVRVGKAKLYDKQAGKMVEVDATFFDLMYIREHVYFQFRRGELPYLSPEFRYGDHEHVHLSALDTESPWFKFPLITIGEEVPYVDKDETAEPEEYGPSLASIRHAQRHALAMRSAHRKEKSMPTDTAKRDALKAELTKIDENLSKLAKRMEDGGSEGDEGTQPAVPDTDGDGQVTLKDVLEQLKALQKIISGMLGGEEQPQQPAQQPPAQTPGPAEQQPPQATRAKPDASTAGTALDDKQADDTATRGAGDGVSTPEGTMQNSTPAPDLAKRLAEQKGEIDALKGKLAKREAAEARETAIRSAEDKLAPLQIPNLRRELEGVFDDRDAGGPSALHAYTNACLRHARTAPPTDWTGEQTVSNEDPEEVQAYMEHGPDIVNRARAEARNWDSAKRSGLTNKDLKTWLGINIPGKKPRAAADAKK